MSATASRTIREDKLLDATGISIDRLPMLHVVFDRLATGCADALRQMSASPTYFSVVGVKSQRFGEAIDAHPRNVVTGVFHSPEWDSRILIGFDRDFMFTLIEILFGADGSKSPYEYDADVRDEEHPFTNIELQVAQTLLELAGKSLRTSFAPVCDTSFKFERVETRMDFAMIGNRGNPAIKAELLMQGLESSGKMFVIIPQTALNPIRQNLAHVLSGYATTRDPRWTRQIQQEVQRTEVKLQAILEERPMTLGEISELKVGQVIELQATPRSQVRLKCNDETVFWCQLGQRDGSYVLRVQDLVNQEQEFFDDLLSR
ncbi:MAG: FliM/FliN family flagellar motor switch protein [Myxococcota bacterium]|jgi:flagellar motor switch protein FliM